jgi:hypothetical protein
MTAYSRRFWYLVSAEMLAAALFSDGMSHDVGRQERDVRRGTSGEGRQGRDTGVLAGRRHAGLK